MESAPLPASSSGRGLLSFLDPSTAEEEAEAASALREKYRLLYEETDARAVCARWRRKRRERLVETRASLRALYADEVAEWNAAVAAETRGRSTCSEKVDVAVEWCCNATIADGSCSGDGDDLRNTNRGSGNRTTEGEDIAVCEWVEVKAAESDVEPNFVGGEGRCVFPGPRRTSAIDAGNSGGLVTTSVETATRRTEGDGTEERRGVSSNVARDGERGRSSAGGYQIGLSDTDDRVKFSPVTIVQEPGGSSSGVTSALGNWAGMALEESSELAEQPPQKFSHIKIVGKSSRSSAAMSRALGADRVDHGSSDRSLVCGSGSLVSRQGVGGGDVVDALPSGFGFEGEERAPSGFFAVGEVEEENIGETSLASFDGQVRERRVDQVLIFPARQHV